MFSNTEKYVPLTEKLTKDDPQQIDDGALLRYDAHEMEGNEIQVAMFALAERFGGKENPGMKILRENAIRTTGALTAYVLPIRDAAEGVQSSDGRTYKRLSVAAMILLAAFHAQTGDLGYAYDELETAYTMVSNDRSGDFSEEELAEIDRLSRSLGD